MEVSDSLKTLLLELLSTHEVEQINHQLSRECRQNSQVLWTGIPRGAAQAWADRRKLQTLTTAMGPLMDKQHPSCLRRTKSDNQWKVYVKGASALFAYRITRQSSKVIVLSQPPPQKLNPNGHTNYQLIEEPILKGIYDSHAVGIIQMVHPTVGGAEEFEYQSWPVDRTEDWTERFSHLTVTRIPWRIPKFTSAMKRIEAILTVAQSSISFNENKVSPSSSADLLETGAGAEIGRAHV